MIEVEKIPLTYAAKKLHLKLATVKQIMRKFRKENKIFNPKTPKIRRNSQKNKNDIQLS